MIIIGVTGNSGSGKSTVSAIIRNNTGAFVIDADMTASILMSPGEEYYKSVVKLFGEDIITTSTSYKKRGRIDKKKLSQLIFSDSEKREQLNKLTFKYVGKKTKEIILRYKDKEVIVLDFPLLYEGGFDKICNCVIGVFADENTKVIRIKERDKINREKALARIRTQMDDEALKEKVDYVVYNNQEKRYITLVRDVVKLVHKIKQDEEEKKQS